MRVLLLMLVVAAQAARNSTHHVDLMEAAQRGATDLETASRFELVARAVALSKLNGLLHRTATQLSGRGCNQTVVTMDSLEGQRMPALRRIVQKLADENDECQRTELASRANLASTSNATTSTSIKEPPASLNCVALQVDATGQGFERQRYDGRKQPRSQADKWTAWLCPPSRSRRGAVWLAKKAAYCDTQEDHPTIGPDELFGTIHGREAVALHWTHQGQCAYVGEFHLSKAGEYHLLVAHLREGATGLSEARPLWPPMHYDFPLGRSGVYVWITVDEEEDDNAELPPCDAWGDQDGRFVYVGKTEQLFRRDRPITDLRPFKAFQARTYKWATGMKPPMRIHWSADINWILAVDPTLYEWQPWTCRLRDFSMTDRQACLAKKRVVMSGDSNVNALRCAVLETACGRACPRGKGRKGGVEHHVCLTKKNGQCQNDLIVVRNAGTCKHLEFGMQIQQFGDVPPPPLTSNSAFLANFGQWPASGKAHYTQAQYRRIVDRWFAAFSGEEPHRNRTTAPMRIWASTIPLVRNDPWVRATQDWRTLSRVRLYNEYADAVAKRYGWYILDEWNLTLPFLFAPREDIAHAAESQRHHHTNLLYNILCA